VGLVLVPFFVVLGGCARAHPPDVAPEHVVELKTRSRASMFDCSRCSLKCFAGVVVVNVVVTAVAGDMVNAGKVVGAGISADVTDVTVRNDRARVLQVPVLCGDRGVARVGTCFARARAWANVSLTRQTRH
jgi:hypothetical protein